METNSASFWVRVKPRSARERLTLDSVGELRLEVYAAPSQGEANRALAEFLARSLRVPRTAVEIVTGQKSRRKLVRISGLPGQMLRAQIEALVVKERAGRVS